MIVLQPWSWIGTSKPNTARMYDYFLGGKDNLPADWEAVGRVIEKFPEAWSLARASRSFLLRAVRFCAEQGVDQFIDIGTGIPTSPAVHEVVREVHPRAHVVGIDHDPVVLCHAHALVDDRAGVRVINGDLQHPAETLSDPVLEQLIDFGQPVVVLLAGVVDCVTDHEDAAASVAMLRDRMAPGSFLVIAHATSTGSNPQVVERYEEVYAQATSPVVFRERSRILGLFDGFHLVEPGLVDVQHWRPHPASSAAVTDVRVLGAVGRRP